MTTSSQTPSVTVKPQPNIYTVLLLVACAALLVAVICGLWMLLASPPSGYGLSVGDLFSAFKEPSALPRR